MDAAIRQANRRLARRLVLAAVAAGGLGFALVPLYDVFCAVTGLNGKTGGAVSAGAVAPGTADAARWVTVELAGNAMPGLSWEFGAKRNRLRVHPGEMVTAAYYVKNPTDRPLSGRAVPSVSPGWAARHFKKVDCFCFKRQQLAPGETREMAVTFFISPELPAEVRALALSYAFYPIEDGS